LNDPCRIEPIPAGPRPESLSCPISVIVPVLDGGAAFAELLRRIRSQKKVGEVEILVLDSESADGSAAVAGSFGCRVIDIPREEFNHGATRDLGARQAAGEYLVFTVQDAVPVGNYWLYGMVCPFLSVPGLGGISARQFVRPEADLYSRWLNHGVNSLIGFTEDSFYGLPPGFDFSGWEALHWRTKRRLSYFDNVSSCIPRGVYDEVPFRPMDNAEDIDFGIRVLGKGRKLGFLTSTGVYHWHDRPPGYFLKRNYIGTKANVHLLKNPLPGFFGKEGIGWGDFVACAAALVDLVSLSLPGPGAEDPSPMAAATSFLSVFRRHSRTASGKTGIDSLESLCPGLAGNAGPDPGGGTRFRENFLAPLFLGSFGAFTSFLAGGQAPSKAREGEFGECVRKILASVIGDAAGAYYLEAETAGRLTEDLERMDGLLAKGVCRA